MDLTDPLHTEPQGLLAPKTEPIDTSFIKTEKTDEDQFVIPGIVEMDESRIKKEIIEPRDPLEAVPSSSNVS